MQIPTANRPGKFHFPHLDDTVLLERPRLQRLLGLGESVPPEIIIVEAQAGQGKTVCISQYLEKIDAPACWYPFDARDCDPLVMAERLADQICANFPHVSLQKLRTMLRFGELALDQLDRIAAMLLKDLPDTRMVWVFDDVHLISGQPQSVALLAHLVRHFGPTMRCILMSRQVLPDAISTSVEGKPCARIGNRELAFSRSETADLFNSVFDRPLTLDAVDRLHRMTSGWIVGLRLVTLNIPYEGAKEREERLHKLNLANHSEINRYFLREVLAQFPAKSMNFLLRLSLLEKIPLNLTSQLGADDDDELLNLLLQACLVVRRQSEGEESFELHHLLRDNLRAQAEDTLPIPEIHSVHLAAADWYAGAKQYEDALRHYLAAASFDQAESILREIGFDLLAVNRVLTLGMFMRQTPESVFAERPWFLFFRGLVLLNTEPPKALSDFERARQLFAADGDETGELLCLTELLSFHVLVAGTFNAADPILARSEELFPRISGRLHPRFHLQASSILTLAVIFIDHDCDRAKTYSAISIQIAEQSGIANARAVSLVGELSIAIFSCDFARCALLAEQALPVLRDPGLAPYWQMVTRVMLCDYLYVSGQFESYQKHSQVVREAMISDLVTSSVAGPIMRLWDIDIAFSTGKVEQARELLQDALAREGVFATPHMRSQYLACQALMDAAAGKGEALDILEEARQLRNIAGGAYHLKEFMVCEYCVRALLGQAPDPDKLLPNASRLGYLTLPMIGALAWYATKIGDVQSADRWVREFMRLWRAYNSDHIYAWNPDVIGAILGWAVKRGCETERARELAARRLQSAITDEGACVPLLQISTLGGLRLETAEGKSLEAKDFSPQHRSLLMRLVTARDHQLPAVVLQCEFWPDSSEKKARASFDTMLGRLRKLLEETFGPSAGKHYLLQKNCMLCLTNCQVDIQVFRRYAESGLRQLRRGKEWAADNHFRLASQVWQGDVAEGESGNHDVEIVREELREIFNRMTAAWIKLKLDGGESKTALEIAERAIRVAPTDGPIVKMLYQTCILNDLPQKAQKALFTYRAALMHIGYDPDEADEALEDLLGD